MPDEFNLGQEIGGIKSDIAHLKSEQAEVKTDIKRLETSVTQQFTDLKLYLKKNGLCNGKNGTNGNKKLNKWYVVIGIVVGVVAVLGGTQGVINIVKAIVKALGG